MTETGRSRPTPGAAPTSAGVPMRLIVSPRARKAPKRTLRVASWTAGGATFLAAWAFIDAAPTPAQSQASPPRARPERQLVVIHHVIRRIIIQEQVTGGSPVATTSSGGGGVVYLPAPVAAPVGSSGGSHP